MSEGDKIATTQWIAWITATLVAALTMSSYVFGNFETKQDAIDKRAQIQAEIAEKDSKADKRLDRIEQKVDNLTKLILRQR
jgi:hypothetical protein